MSEWLDENLAVIFIVSIGIVLCGLILWSFSKYLANEERRFEIIKTMGYDKHDVEVYLETLGFNSGQFINSKGLRAQYESWSRGENTGFSQLVAAKNAKDAAESARTAATVAAAAAITSAASHR